MNYATVDFTSHIGAGCCGLTETLGFGAEIRKLETNRPTYFIERVPAGLDPAIYKKVFFESVNIWSLVCDLLYEPVERVEDAIVTVTMEAFHEKVLGQYILGKANYPNGECRMQYIWFNSLRKWTTSTSRYAGLGNIRFTIYHEGGHTAGLVHPPEGNGLKEIMDSRVNKDLYRPARTEAAIMRMLYGPAKSRLFRFFMNMGVSR